MRRILKQADEYDVFTKWRRVLYFRPGVIAKIKRRVNKRERQELKEQIRTNPEDA